jgi:bifunctional non-homologous end joining protein LigD
MVRKNWTDEEIKIVLDGSRVSARYGLIRIRDDQWLMHRMDPPGPVSGQPAP